MQPVNIKPMVEFVQDYDRPEHVGELLDEVLFEYTCKKIAECEHGRENEIVNKMATLRELRDVFWRMGG